MSKITTIRMSGLPVDKKEFDEFHDKWKIFFDRVTYKYAPKQGEEDYMEKHQAAAPKISSILNRYERMLGRKYKSEVDWEEVNNKEKWQELTKEYGPILIASRQDNGELMYIIADRLQA